MRGWAVSTPTPSLAQLPRGSEVGAAAGVPGTQETSLRHGTDCPGAPGGVFTFAGPHSSYCFLAWRLWGLVLSGPRQQLSLWKTLQ